MIFLNYQRLKKKSPFELPTIKKEEPDLIGVPKGIRTPVSSVKGRCPRPLDDGNVGEKKNRLKNGGSRWIRTIDPFIKSEMLYQLS